jgi:prophage regulatory protein
MEEHLSRRIIRKPEVRNRTGLSDAQCWRLEQVEKFPRRVQLGPLAVGWYEDEIDEWIHTRIRAGGRQPPLPNRRRPAGPSSAPLSGDQSQK